jgi:hypothetical protein
MKWRGKRKRTFDLREIAKEYLERHGFDGLATCGCGCELRDLMPCGEPSPDCEPAYKELCQEGCWCGGEFDIHFQTASTRDRAILERKVKDDRH